MLVEFETTTEIAACVLHDLTAKIIRTPPVYRFVLQVQNNLKKYRSELKIVLPKQKKERTNSEFTALLAPNLPTSCRSSLFGWLSDKCN